MTGQGEMNGWRQGAVKGGLPTLAARMTFTRVQVERPSAAASSRDSIARSGVHVPPRAAKRLVASMTALPATGSVSTLSATSRRATWSRLIRATSRVPRATKCMKAKVLWTTRTGRRSNSSATTLAH